jgi:DmsE family decaheme c-type cytochrome
MRSTAWSPQRVVTNRTLPPNPDGGPAWGPPRAFLAACLFLSTSLFAAQSPPAGYVGSDTCQTCHDDFARAFQKNPHHFIETRGKNGWKGMACESCHGPGAKHAETTSASDIVNPAKGGAAKADQICLKCHLNQPTQVGRIHSSHAKDQVACTSCHAIHKGPQSLRPTRLASINEQCATCHRSIWAQFQKPYKHRLVEGAMSCTDCHNPHGTLLGASLRLVAGDERGCFRCHGDKRGPFTFEHPPMKTDGCIACHEPHGSANPRMLTRHEVRLVCLECHSNIGVRNTIGGVPPSFHNLNSARYQNCTICHVKIHGSYVDAALER